MRASWLCLLRSFESVETVDVEDPFANERVLFLLDGWIDRPALHRSSIQIEQKMLVIHAVRQVEAAAIVA